MTNRTLRMRTKVTAKIDGKKLTIDPNSIGADDWKRHSDPEKNVASLYSTTIGETTLVRNGSQVLSASTDEVDVFSIQHLESQGYEIKAPKSS